MIKFTDWVGPANCSVTENSALGSKFVNFGENRTPPSSLTRSLIEIGGVTPGQGRRRISLDAEAEGQRVLKPKAEVGAKLERNNAPTMSRSPGP